MVVLLTGATGAVGAALLEVLATSDSVSRVYALVRRTPLPRSLATSSKIRTVDGDITRGPGLGIGQAVHDELVREVSAVVHAAADTRFGAPAEVLRTVNVAGTANVLAFAARCSGLERVSVLSTVYVAGTGTGRVPEAPVARPAGFVNAYESSKWEAEALVQTWVDRLPVSVIRLGLVIGPDAPGARPLAAVHQAIRLMYRSLVPMVPGRADHRVDLVPIDYAARAAARLATSAFEPSTTFQVVGGDDTMTIGELLDLTMETFSRCRPAWRGRAIARPAVVGLPTFELFRQSVEEVGDEALRASTEVIRAFAPQLAYPKTFDESRCRAALAGSGIERPPVRPAYTAMVERLVGTFHVQA